MISVGSAYNNVAGYSLSEPGNPNLQWQKQRKHTLAVMSEFFQNRLSLNVELYQRIISDMVINTDIPYLTGFGAWLNNGAKFQNKGIDVMFSVEPLRTKNSSINAYFSLNYNKEEVLALPDGNRTYINTGTAHEGSTLFEVGQPRTFVYPIFNRVNPDTGAPEWFNPSSDVAQKTTDANDVTSNFNSVALRQNTGLRKTAPFGGGFGMTARYKTLSFDVNFAFSSGKCMINRDRYFSENPPSTVAVGVDNQSVVIFDHWKQPGDNARFPSKAYQFTQYDSRLLEDASFIRMKTIGVSYSLPAQYIKEVGFFRDIRFHVTGRNLLTFTKYTGADPELDGASSLAGNPSTREYTFGIDIKF